MPAKKRPTRREEGLQRKIEDLETQLAEAGEALQAIGEGAVDAVIVSGDAGDQIFSLNGTDSIYRLIVETMKEAAFTVTFDGTILFCNAQFGQFVGLPLEQIVGHQFQEFLTGNNHVAASSFLITAQQQPVKQRLAFQGADGTAMPVHVSASILNQPDNVSICVVASDLTELENSTELIQQLRRQQKALQESEERFRILNENLERLIRERTSQLNETVQRLEDEIVERKLAEEEISRIAREWQTTFDAIRDPVLLMDSDYGITRANDAAGAFLDLPLSEILGSRYQTLFPWPHGTGAANPITAAMASRCHEEVEWLDEARKAWLLISADPILAESGSLQGVIQIIKNITNRKAAEERLHQSLEELQKLKDHLRDENIHLRQEVKTLSGSTDLIGQSPAFQHVLLQVEQVAATDATVLLLGETGSGKEALAKAIHRLSSRRDRPLVCVNCAALPATLIENELFGREKGAYTGAATQQSGRFELAHKATLFLDEIGDLTPDLQIKLLRVLAERQIERLGGTRSISVDVRVIAATNQDLEKAMQEGRFRRDLYYRLNVFPINVPSLRERREDIPLLVRSLVDQLGREMGKPVESIDASDMDALLEYDWPGNIRELRNLVERALITSNGPKLRILLPETARTSSLPSPALQDMERDHIQQILLRTRWRIRGANGAAEILGMKPSTLESRMAKLGIRRPI